METPIKKFGTLNIIAAAFNICQAWASIGATFALSIEHGGSTTIIYGSIVIFLVYSAIALSLAELAARYPTAGGQYHWTAILAPEPFKRQLSYTCGCINNIGWIMLSASVIIIPSQIVIGVIQFCHPLYTIKRWHIFLLYQVLNLAGLSYNVLALQKASWTHNIGFGLSLLLFLTATITCLAISDPKQSARNVWESFTNSTDWKAPGVVFFTGLINLNYGFAGLDGAIHLAEDCSRAEGAVPWALVSAVLISFVTTFVFIVAALYCIKDFEAVVSTSTQIPLYEIWHQATQSKIAATILILFLAMVLMFTLIAVQQTASRLTWALARDDALVYSDKIKQLDKKFKVPIWALVFNSVWGFVIGCVYLGSSTAFNAIVGPGLILEQLSFAIPVTLLMWRNRDSKFRPKAGPFNLGTMGWLANSVTVGWAVLELIFYNMPTELPVTSNNMNYTPAVLGGIGLFILSNWFLYGKRHYKGPRVDLSHFPI